MNDIKELGQLMKSYRKAMGYNVYELSQKLGYKGNYVALVECGARTFKLPILEKWANICIPQKIKRTEFLKMAVELYQKQEIDKQNLVLIDLYNKNQNVSQETQNKNKLIQAKIEQIYGILKEIEEIL